LAHAAWALVAVLTTVMSACGGAQANDGAGLVARVEDDSAGATRYAAALRLAALARVEARAGLDEVAAEHYRAAYRQHPEAGFLVAQAQAAANAKLYAEAQEATERALLHAWPEDARQKLEAEAKRLAGLVPKGLHRVAVQVTPDSARVELRHESQPKDTPPLRTVLGTGWVYLQAGTWSVESTARGYQSELRTFSVGRGGELLSVALSPEDQGPAIARTTPRPPDKRAPEVRKAPDAQVKGPEKIALPEIEPGAEPKPEQVSPGPTLRLGYDDGPKRSKLATYGPLATSGLGVVAIGLGGFFGYQAASQGTEANALTGKEKNYTTLRDFHIELAKTASLRSNLAFASGGALVAIGTAWWLFTMPGKAPPATVTGRAPGIAAKTSVQTRAAGWQALAPDAVAVWGRRLDLSWRF